MAKKFIDLNNIAPIKIEKNFKGWLSDDCLARFIVDIVDQLDTSDIESQYTSGGSRDTHLKCLLL